MTGPGDRLRWKANEEARADELKKRVLVKGTEQQNFNTVRVDPGHVWKFYGLVT